MNIPSPARSRVECLTRGVEQCTHRLLRRSAGQRLAGGGKKALYGWLDGHARSHAGLCPPAMMERVMGIEPTYAAWEAAVLPLNYTRVAGNSTAQAFMMNMNSAARAARLSAACSFASLAMRSEEHTSELQSPCNLVCRLLLEKKKKTRDIKYTY